MALRPFRVPLTGAYNSRISPTNVVDGSSGYVGIGVVGTMVVGKSSDATNKDARFVNCFPQTILDPITGKRKAYLVKRPGWAVASTPEAGSIGSQVLVWTGQGTGQKVISAFGGTNSTIYDGETSLGAITGLATGLTETTVGSNVPTIAITSSDSTAWYYDVATGSATKITDGQFPGNAGKTLAGTFCHMDGYACIMDTTGVLWASDLNSLTAWTANSYDTASAFPDPGIAAIRQGQFILCFGPQSLQFFYNNGSTPFPFVKATAKTIKTGAISADAIAQIADTVFWCGSTPEGGLSIFQYDGNLSRISIPEIEALIILAGTSNISLTTVRYYGRAFLRVKASARIYVYCLEEKAWFEEFSTTPLATKISSTSIGTTMVNYAVSNISTAGKVFVMNHSSLVFTDNGASYTAQSQLPPMDMGTMRKKFWADLELVCDRESSASAITLSYSDDDYQTTTTWGDLDLSDARPRATRLGSSRRRSWILTHAAATGMRIEAIEGNAEIGV